jgi:hypothetical protein
MYCDSVHKALLLYTSEILHWLSLSISEVIVGGLETYEGNLQNSLNLSLTLLYDLSC